MYAALWRAMPGPAWLRAIIVLIVLAAIVYGLFFYVFPWISPIINPAQDVTVE